MYRRVDPIQVICSKMLYVIGVIFGADRHNNFEWHIQPHNHLVGGTLLQTKILVWSGYWPSIGYKLELDL